MLHSGMIVMTRQGAVLLKGRNSGRNAWQWWGHRIRSNGKPDTDTMPVVTSADVLAVKNCGAFQGVLPGVMDNQKKGKY